MSKDHVKWIVRFAYLAHCLCAYAHVCFPCAVTCWIAGGLPLEKSIFGQKMSGTPVGKKPYCLMLEFCVENHPMIFMFRLLLLLHIVRLKVIGYWNDHTPLCDADGMVGLCCESGHWSGNCSGMCMWASNGVPGRVLFDRRADHIGFFWTTDFSSHTFGWL